MNTLATEHVFLNVSLTEHDPIYTIYVYKRDSSQKSALTRFPYIYDTDKTWNVVWEQQHNFTNVPDVVKSGWSLI